MAQIDLILGQVRGFAQDYARESMPQGFCWSLLDLMPTVVGANLRSRNAWTTHANLPAGYVSTGGIYSTFEDGRFLAVVGKSGATNNLYEITPGGAAVLVGAVVPTLQNPFPHREGIVIPNGSGVVGGKAKGVIHANGFWTIVDLPTAHYPGRYGCTYKDRVVLANTVDDPEKVSFGQAGDPLKAWEPLSFIKTSLPVTGIAALRNSILVFHEAMTERIRGSTPPDPALSNPTGDMVLEPFPSRVGCAFAHSIAYWKDSVIWADERGVHMTDGAATVNLAEKGGMGLAWRSIFDLNVQTMAAGCVGDFYMVTMKVATAAPLTGFTPGSPLIPGEPVASENYITLVCNVPTRTWTRFANVPASCYIPTHGADDRERLFAGTDAQRVINVTESLYPTYISGHTAVDGNGYGFRPLLETPWFTFTNNRERIRNIYLNYELDSASASHVGVEIATKLTSEPVSLEYKLLTAKANKHTKLRRQRIPIRREVSGIAFRFVVNGSFRYFNFYGLEAETWSRSKIALAPLAA